MPRDLYVYHVNLEDSRTPDSKSCAWVLQDRWRLRCLVCASPLTCVHECIIYSPRKLFSLKSFFVLKDFIIYKKIRPIDLVSVCKIGWQCLGQQHLRPASLWRIYVHAASCLPQLPRQVGVRGQNQNKQFSQFEPGLTADHSDHLSIWADKYDSCSAFLRPRVYTLRVFVRLNIFAKLLIWSIWENSPFWTFVALLFRVR